MTRVSLVRYIRVIDITRNTSLIIYRHIHEQNIFCIRNLLTLILNYFIGQKTRLFFYNSTNYIVHLFIILFISNNELKVISMAYSKQYAYPIHEEFFF